MNSHNQSGSVLLISLLMLVAMTLFALSSINSGMINLHVVDNMQVQKQAESAARRVINDSLSSVATFNSPAASAASADGYGVQVSEPRCIATQPAPGYSAVWGLAPEETEWEFTAAVNDAATGARVTMTQGVALRMTAGSCP